MFESWGEFLITSAVIGLCVFGVVSCNQSDWYQEKELAAIERGRANAIPRLVSEGSGCKVYAFQTDSVHYFTKCGTTTTTDTIKNCGKNCKKTESIVTENK